MTTISVLDAAGRRRSPATMPGYHAGRPPRNKGIRYPADPPTVDEIVAVMRHTGDDRHGFTLRATIVVLWRTGLRIHEALAPAEHELDPRRGSLLLRHGKGGRRREVGMDDWGWDELRPWLTTRAELPVGPLFCVIADPTRGRPWSAAAVRTEFRKTALAVAQAGVRRRGAPHQLRHAHALATAMTTGSVTTLPLAPWRSERLDAARRDDRGSSKAVVWRPTGETLAARRKQRRAGGRTAPLA